jgi:hypothetical protein
MDPLCWHGIAAAQSSPYPPPPFTIGYPLVLEPVRDDVLFPARRILAGCNGLGSSATPFAPRQAGQCVLLERLPQGKTVRHLAHLLALVAASKAPGKLTGGCVGGPRGDDDVLQLDFLRQLSGLWYLSRDLGAEPPNDKPSSWSSSSDCSRRKERRLRGFERKPVRIAARRSARLRTRSATDLVTLTPLSIAGGSSRTVTSSLNRTVFDNASSGRKYRCGDINSNGSGSNKVTSALLTSSSGIAGNPIIRRPGSLSLLRPLKTTTSSSGVYDARHNGDCLRTSTPTGEGHMNSRQPSK